MRPISIGYLCSMQTLLSSVCWLAIGSSESKLERELVGLVLVSRSSFAISLSWQIVAAVAAIAEILLRLRAKVHFHSLSKTFQLH